MVLNSKLSISNVSVSLKKRKNIEENTFIINMKGKEKNTNENDGYLRGEIYGQKHVQEHINWHGKATRFTIN